MHVWHYRWGFNTVLLILEISDEASLLVATIFNSIFSIKEVPITHDEREGLGTLWFFLPLLATNLVATVLVAYKVW